MTEDGRDTDSHHTPCSRECDAAKQSTHKLKQPDELFIMMYDKNTKLEEDLKDA